MDNCYIETYGSSISIKVRDIPLSEYDIFYEQVAEFLSDESCHCISYYGIRSGENIYLYCCLADDKNHSVRILKCQVISSESVRSLVPVCPQLYIFEREIHENFGVLFEGHPWLKPVRYPFDRMDQSSLMDNYPFYKIDSEELHEVGVGPIHAGVIEPGHFRFICNGEKVLHLEIQLGYQHRGIERLFIKMNNGLQRATMSESIAGDTSVGHSLAHSQLVERLAGIMTSDVLRIERCIGLEMERIAVHIGDTAALCGDVAYQLGQVVCEALRTEVINATQFWCGNRFGKGLVRPGGSNYPMGDAIYEKIRNTLKDIGPRYSEIAERIYSMPSVLARFEDIGQVTRDQAVRTGAVGMAARTCGLLRDIRMSHPFQYYDKLEIKPVTFTAGDVLARGLLRVSEVNESLKLVNKLIEIRQGIENDQMKPVYNLKMDPGRLAISLVEGWRGEICHSAITDDGGNLVHYKIKDPSFHNWMALALAVRNQEISDFPVCNKSFNLSYCGNDL
jgi:Ni,Fe-hydrogenase III large subunit/NADH:ubiquinone oxidoreductase subunit C